MQKATQLACIGLAIFTLADPLDSRADHRLVVIPSATATTEGSSGAGFGSQGSRFILQELYPAADIADLLLPLALVH